MTWHPTTNLIQTDLLTREQREALEAWPHGHECYYGAIKWRDETPEWIEDCVYRGKPAPFVTSKWFNVYTDLMDGPFYSSSVAGSSASEGRIDVLRIDTCNGVSAAHLEGLE